MPSDRPSSKQVSHPSGAFAEKEDAMLWDSLMMIGCGTVGSDGELGTVSDLLFDDATWRVRWIVVNTRYWFPRHEVVLPISVLGRPDPLRRRLGVDLTMQQIADSPLADHHSPVSQQADLGRDDPHLRSVESMIGHRVQLLDSVVGHVEELLVHDDDWSIRYIRIDTCKWRPGDRVLLAPRFVREIDWAGRMVRFDADRREIEGDQMRPDVIWMRSRSDGTNTDV
jgi:hypothetical protein